MTSNKNEPDVLAKAIDVSKLSEAQIQLLRIIVEEFEKVNSSDVSDKPQKG